MLPVDVRGVLACGRGPLTMLALLAAFGGCGGDAVAPDPPPALRPGPRQSPAAPQAPGLLTAAFESNARVSLGAGEELYIAGVYFDTSQPVYLAQVGITRNGVASLVLLQRSYRIQNDSILFDGDLLTPGVLEQAGAVLRTRIRHDGGEIEVAMPQIRD